MGKITEKGTGKGEYYTMKDVLGQIFEISEDVNANSEFRDVPKKAGKEGNYLSIIISMNGQVKDLHLTVSALREIRDCLGIGGKSWKGQRLTCTGLAKDFKPASFKRIDSSLGSYSFQPSTPTAAQTTAQAQIVDPAGMFLQMIGNLGLPDSSVISVLTDVCGGDQNKANFIFGMLKSSGKVVQRPDGNWVRT